MLENASLTREPPLTDAHLRAIGWVTVQFSTLDFFVNVAVTHLLNLHIDDGVAIGDLIHSTKTRVEILKIIAKRKMPPGGEKDAFLILINNIIKLNKERNKYIHHIWTKHSEESAEHVYLMKIRSAETVGDDAALMTPEDIENFAHQVAAATNALLGTLAFWRFPSSALRIDRQQGSEAK